MIYHLITLLATAIAGLTGAALGGPLMAFAAAASVFTSLLYIGPQNATERVWWQTDIIYKIRQYIAIAIHAAAHGIVDDLRSQPRGALSRSITGNYPADRRYIEHTTEPPIPWANCPHCALCKEWRTPMAYTKDDQYLCGSCYYAIDSHYQPAWKPIGFIEYTGETIRLS